MTLLKHKTFIKKTRRGKIIKVVREHYLRNDIICGIHNCQLCGTESNKGILSPQAPPSLVPHLFPQAHYLLLDTNIVLEHMDVVESPAFQNVILLQTVLAEVSHRSTPIYKRLKDLMSSDRQFFVFLNEHHPGTYVERLRGESVNDRNDRAIRESVLWYTQTHGVSVLLLSDDKENVRKAKEMKIHVFSLTEYLKALTNFPELIDKMKFSPEESSRNVHGVVFPNYVSQVEIKKGIQDKRIFTGVFHVSPMNYLEGTVFSVNFPQPILIQGLSHCNRSVDGDVVAVSLLEKEDWTAPSEVLLEDTEESNDIKGSSSLLLDSVPKLGVTVPTGKIIGIISRKWRHYCGILQSNSSKNSFRHIFIPFDKKIPKIMIMSRQGEFLINQRIMVAIDIWPHDSRYPLGHFVKVLGPLGDTSIENEVLLLENDIPFSSFSKQVLDCLPSLPFTPTLSQNRVDLRHLDTLVSIDPPGCTDIDDALHSRVLHNGNFEIGVHIADVSHFIRPGSPLDEEAANRSTTVYLTDRRIDMIPPLLSGNICSLLENEDRYVFSVIWEICSSTGDFLSTTFQKSLIRSRGAFTYEKAQTIIDDESRQDSVATSLRRLLFVSKILKEKRRNDGALALASSEIKFLMDSETADPIELEIKRTFETNSMVEEFMLAANIAAAKRIVSYFPDVALLRRHPSPPPSNFDSLVKAGKIQGFNISIDSNKSLAASLDEAIDERKPYFNTMLRMIATRCMMQALYFSAGTLESSLYEHYGLASPIYTHFTSPIRRYADILVHRYLAVSLGLEPTYPDLLSQSKISSLASHCNTRHRNAQKASRASVSLHTIYFFRHETRDEEGYILFIRSNAIIVLIPRFGLEGTLYLKSSSSSQNIDFDFDEETPSQSSQGISLTLFQRVKVQISLDSSNVQHEKLTVHLVEPYIPGFSVKSVSKRSLSEDSISESSPSKKKHNKRSE